MKVNSAVQLMEVGTYIRQQQYRKIAHPFRGNGENIITYSAKDGNGNPFVFYQENYMDGY